MERDVEQVFAKCLVRAWVLDLSGLAIGLPSAARVFERFWTESIDVFLKRRSWLDEDQNYRAEWRHLANVHRSISEEQALVQHLAGLAAKIEAMSDLLRVGLVEG